MQEDDMNVHIWDFAGHVVTHAAHRCFLSERCLYIIVCDGRSEQRNRLEYWLDHVENYGGDSKVMIFVNLRDGHKPQIPENRLKAKYPIVNFKYFSIHDDRMELKKFRSQVVSFMRDNPLWNKLELPSTYYAIKDELLNRFRYNKKNMRSELMTLASFHKIAEKEGIDRSVSTQLLESLHALGICLWYKNLATFDTLVLNPEWISHGIYRLINWALEATRYRISAENYGDVFAEEQSRYPESKFPFLFQLMCEYELAYEEKGSSTYVIPFLLDEDQPPKLPEYSIDDSLMLEYTVEGALPPDVIPRFIVLRNMEIANSGRGAWRHGVVLNSGRATALVIEDDRKIKVYVKGGDKTDYIGKLRETLNNIFETYRSKKPELAYRISSYGSPDLLVKALRDTPVMLSEKAIVGHIVNGRDSYFEPESGTIIPLQPVVQNYNIYMQGGKVEIGNKNKNEQNFYMDVTGNVAIANKGVQYSQINNNVMAEQVRQRDQISDEDLQAILDGLKQLVDSGELKRKDEDAVRQLTTEVEAAPKASRWSKIRASLGDGANIAKISEAAVKVAPALIALLKTL